MSAIDYIDGNISVVGLGLMIRIVREQVLVDGSSPLIKDFAGLTYVVFYWTENGQAALEKGSNNWKVEE